MFDWSSKPTIRGTAGGVAGARAYLSSHPVLVWNGDILVAPPLDQLLVRCEPHSFCLGVAPRPLGEGTVGLDAQGHVVRLRGERFGTEVQGGDYVGVLALGAEVLASLPERGCLFGDAALPLLRARRHACSSVPVTTPWTDAGDARELAGRQSGVARRSGPRLVSGPGSRGRARSGAAPSAGRRGRSGAGRGRARALRGLPRRDARSLRCAMPSLRPAAG